MEKHTGGLILMTLLCMPSVLTRTSLSLQELQTNLATLGACRRVDLLVTNSIPAKRPMPLTSPMTSKSRARALSDSRMCLPTTLAFSCRRSCLITLSTAWPAATAALHPPKVLKYSIPPLENFSASSLLRTTAERGNPLPILLPRITMSGTTPWVWKPQKCAPVRPKPHWTSSAMHTAPTLLIAP